MLAIGRGEHFLDETVEHNLRFLVFDKRAGIEVDQLDLNFDNCVLVEIFIVGTNEPNGVPRPVVNNTN